MLQEKRIRQFYSQVFWLTVGADAVDGQLRQLQGVLHKLLTGKSIKSDEASAKSMQEMHEILAAAMAKKERALLVLDDPWMPEQVRCDQVGGTGCVGKAFYGQW